MDTTGPQPPTLLSRLSFWPMRVGNLPALFRPGPKRRGIILMTESDARKAAYFLAANRLQEQRLSVCCQMVAGHACVRISSSAAVPAAGCVYDYCCILSMAVAASRNCWLPPPQGVTPPASAAASGTISLPPLMTPQLLTLTAVGFRRVCFGCGVRGVPLSGTKLPPLRRWHAAAVCPLKAHAPG